MLSFYLSMVETPEQRDKVTFIYERFHSFMCYTAGQVLGQNSFDVEDAVHNAMLRIIENLDLIDLSDLRRAKNLCGIIARNKAIDHCRRKDSQNIPLDDEAVEVLHSDDDPGEIVIRRDMYDIILKKLRTLDDSYRDVCILKYVHNLKEREIAELLDISPKTVSSRIFRGKQILREALAQEGIYVS